MLNNGDRGKALEDIRERFVSVIKLLMFANWCLSNKCCYPPQIGGDNDFFFILSVS